MFSKVQYNENKEVDWSFPDEHAGQTFEANDDTNNLNDSLISKTWKTSWIETIWDNTKLNAT